MLMVLLCCFMNSLGIVTSIANKTTIFYPKDNWEYFGKIYSYLIFLNVHYLERPGAVF
jgi:hypothetical protein